MCDGKCCKYVTVILGDPEDEEDWDEIKWMLMHENVSVYHSHDDEWRVEFVTPCRHLTKGNKCAIYDKRPAVCREYTVDECELSDEDYADVIFLKPEDVDGYRKDKEKKDL